MDHSKIALITGCSSGFGRSLANLLIIEGWTVIGIARREDKLEELKIHFGNHFIYFKCDVSKQKEIEKVNKEIKKLNLHPNLFILNAGQLDYEENFKVEEHIKTFSVNYFGVISFIDEWLPSSLKKGATFIGISSLAAVQSLPNMSAYCASKSAIASTFESLRLQYLNAKVKFVTVFPGPMNTDMVRSKENVYFIADQVDSADYVLKKTFAGKQIIKFPFAYSFMIKLANLLPKWIVKKFIDYKPSPFKEQSDH